MGSVTAWVSLRAHIASAYHSESPKTAHRIDVWLHGGEPPLCGPISPPTMATVGEARRTLALTARATTAFVSSTDAFVKPEVAVGR